jgi:hypothetical protein
MEAARRCSSVIRIDRLVTGAGDDHFFAIVHLVLRSAQISRGRVRLLRSHFSQPILEDRQNHGA